MRIVDLWSRLTNAFRIRQLRGDAGISVMEVIVAITIIGGVMASASIFFISGLRNTTGHSQRQTAVTLANQALESAQSISPTSLVLGRDCTNIYNFTHTAVAASIISQDQIASSLSGQATAGNCDTSGAATSEAVPRNSTYVVNGVTYSIDTYINYCWLLGSTSSGNCTPTNVGGTRTQIYRVSVDVSFAPLNGMTCSGFLTGRCDYVASTLIDPTDDPTFNSNVSQPTITSVNPSSLQINTTNNTVTLSGTNFVNGVSLSIASGGGVITGVTFNTGNAITFTMNTGTTAGTYLLTLLNPDGGTTTTSIAENGVPNITGISPGSVSAGSTTSVTITGTSFQNGFTLSTIAGGTMSNIAYVSPTQATFSFVANGTIGTYTITMTNPGGGFDTATFTVKSVPTITSISPSSVGASSTKTLTLTGTQFVSGATIVVSSGGTTSSATVLSATSATVSFTATSTAGSRTLVLTNPDGGTVSKTFTVNAAPTITSVTNLACTATTQNFTITGTGLVTGATISDTAGDTFGAVTANAGNTSATFTVIRNGAIGSNRTLTFTNPDGGSVTNTLTATNCAAPTISAVTPGSGSVKSPLTITLTGTGFLQGTAVTSKKGSSAYGTASNVVVNSAGTSVTFTWTASPVTGSATYTFTVTQDGGDTASKSVTYSGIT